MPGARFELSTEDLKALNTFPICAEMSDSDKSTFARHLIGFKYSASEMLFTRNNHLYDHLFIILEGKVEIASQLAGSSDPETYFLSQQPGDTVGILSFIDGRKHVACAEAKKDMRTAVLTRQDYIHLKSNHPEVATHILEYLISATDDLACKLMIKYNESIAYMNEARRPRSTTP